VSDPKTFLNALDHDRIVAAIRAAESRGRGEIRVHVARGEVADAQRAAVADFERLNMTATAERNGVLVFVAPASRKFAVIGDAGIHQHCGDAFWQEVAAAMREDFAAGRFTDGIVRGVERAGAVMADHFPRRPGEADRNELPDEVSQE
jgi:uncharacterized membrane protein